MENKEINMEADKVGPIPRYYHEAETARLERVIRRLFWALVLTILLLVGTNAAWIWYESQFEDTVVTQDVDTGDGYSSTGDMADQLRSMMDEAPDERTRQELQRLASKLDR